MADVEKIREHVEKHKDRERAMFTVAGVGALLDELDRLREALEPFAREATEWSKYDDAENLVEPWPGSPNSGLCVGDLRAAARALSAQVEERE